jgi:hypothetical protein
MQTVDVLEPNESQIDPIPFDIVLAQRQLLRRFMGIGIVEIESRLIDEQLYRLGSLSRRDGGEERDGFDFDWLVELDDDG